MKRLFLGAALLSSFALAGSMTVNLDEVNEKGIVKSVGTVTITETQHGLVFTPNLKGLAPGIHGFHIHENPSCDSTDKGPAMAAGGHFDPDKTGRHSTPWDDKGHLGDLPALYITKDGVATQPVLAPRIKQLSQIKNRSIMVHVGGDNHSDDPLPLGGGGARMACGVIK